MTNPLLLVLLTTAAADDFSARYVMLFSGAPAGTISISQKANQLTYSADQFFERASDGSAGTHFKRVFDVTQGPPAETLWLSTQKPVGCVDALEERSGETEKVCIDTVKKRQVTGRIAETKFTALYGADGRLQVLQFPGVEFRQSNAQVAPGVAPFADGFALTKGPKVGLVPALKGSALVKVTPAGEAGKEVNCLDAARQYATAHAGALTIIGLVIEDGRAWPHAWSRVKGADVDPSVPSGADVSGRQYLALPQGQAGQVFLELAAGSRKVTASVAD